MEAQTPIHITESCELRVVRADITQLDVDAIVNAANPGMLGGGGVDGAIHRAAGPELLEACRQVREIRPGVRCPTGEARITPGFGLTARYVIHAVGPRYVSTEDRSDLLRGAYRSSLGLANAHGLKTIAMPAISCGIYGYPHLESVGIVLNCCADYAGQLETIFIALMSDSLWNAYGRGIRNFQGG